MLVKSYPFALLLGLTIGAIMSVPQAGNIHPSLIGPRQFHAAADSVDVWVFFKDHGVTSESALAQELSDTERNLLPKARQRRQNVMTDVLVDIHDLQVQEQYVRSVIGKGVRLRTVSKYLNAMSIRTTQSNLRSIAALDFVGEIRPIAKGWRPPPDPKWFEERGSYGVQPAGIDELNYGPSYEQLNQINVVAVHDSGYSGNGVLVCLLDTGFFTDHEALVDQPVIAEWDFINNDPETQNEPGDDEDQHNHGTYTFSALGGAHDGDLYGPAYGATFIIGKTESVEMEEPIEEDWYVAGLEWADSLGAQIVSTSLGYIDWYEFEDMDGNTTVTAIGVDIAVSHGVVCVTAAGNERESSWGHIITPSDADSVIAVGAVNSEGVIASFSSPGPTADGRIKPEVCARGVSTWCATPWNGTSGYYGIGGTSLSTPLVGGACALILEAHPEWTPIMVKKALMGTACNASFPNNDYGWGIIDVLAAINYNFPPEIQQQHPSAGSTISYVDSLQDFWISVTDYEGDPLVYSWWIDDDEVQYGADSAFSYAWSQTGVYSVRAYVVDTYLGLDSTAWEVTVEPWGNVSGNDQAGIPERFALYENYPNPFNPTTTIEFDLAHGVQVNLNVYDISSRLVERIVDSYLPAGRYQTEFNASGLTSGVYIYRIEAGQYSAHKKLILLK